MLLQCKTLNHDAHLLILVFCLGSEEMHFEDSRRKEENVKDKRNTLMIYSFICPSPCNREIIVEAQNNVDAVEKMITAGAISCRNSAKRLSCEKRHFDMSPISPEQLKNIIGLCMRQECEA